MKTFQKAPLALAITALMVAPYALAGGGEHELETSLESNFYNNIEVGLEHNSTTNKHFRVSVGVRDHRGNSYSGALVDSKQVVDYNRVDNHRSENNATVGGSGGAGASGNIGINVAAGDNNAQANDAALSASDANRVFGQAEAYSAQSASDNDVNNYGSPNTARMGGSALSGATGNIGVNIAAGVGNIQQNSLAASANTSAGSARATAAGQQTAYDNHTDNKPYLRQQNSIAVVEGLEFEVDASNLKMDQIGDVYLDIWEGELHPSGPAIGHVDVDSAVQGAQDLNNDGGAFAFSATEDSVLSGTISGQIPVVETVYDWHSNNATLGGSALSGASGNIGVNIAAGTNNMQRNSLAIASSSGGSANGGGSGE